MNQLETIKSNIVDDLKKIDINVYDVLWRSDHGMKILEISITNVKNIIDLDICAQASEVISNKLDELDIINDEYFLEVCSPGAERVLRNYEEVKEEIGKFIYVEFNNPIKNVESAKGTIISIEDDEMYFEYMDKAVKKKLTFKYEDIKFIRLSVKI